MLQIYMNFTRIYSGIPGADFLVSVTAHTHREYTVEYLVTT